MQGEVVFIYADFGYSYVFFLIVIPCGPTKLIEYIYFVFLKKIKQSFKIY